MNTREYIETGILELYATGSLTPREMQEVEAMVTAHPEVANELRVVEETLVIYASSDKLTPRPELKEKVMNAVVQSIADENRKVVAMHSPVKQNTPKRLYYAIAACIALLIVTNVGLVVMWNNWKQTREELARVATSYAESNQHLNMLRSPSFVKVRLKGMDIAPEAVAMVHWNPENHHLMLDFIHLPVPDSNHQYQLWALMDGQPIDAGVFTISTGMQEMKNITAAQAFAVTLEPRGGSDAPTMDKMYLYASL